jgi:polysaccharide biosynthesis/export protein
MRNKRIVQIAILLFLIGSFLYGAKTASVFALEKSDDTLGMNMFSENKNENSSDKKSSENNLELSEFLKIQNNQLKMEYFQRLSSPAQVKLFQNLSNENTDRLYLFKSVNEVQQVKIFQGLDKNEQFNFYKSLSKEDQANVFNNLDLTEQNNIFKNLDEAGQLNLFQGMNKAEQLGVFRELNKSKQQNLFTGLPKSQQLDLFENLSKSEQLNVFRALSKSEQSVFEAMMKEEPSSEVEDIFSGQFPKSVSTELSQYGYSFFNKESSATFEPVENVPVGDDYVIGPGDSFTANIWGNAEESFSTTVTRDGDILLPHIGMLNVNGLTFAELKDFLNNKLKEYYRDFKMNVTMESLRTINIFIIGEANNPGTYSVNSLSTMITALYASGGPSKRGSLRNIKLMRNGDVVKTLDLYNFFIKGDKNDDVRLQPGDTIFIPVIEPVAGIAGYVKRPAIYEMKGRQTIGDIIEIAGGLMSVGYLQNVVVERTMDHQTRVIKSFNLDPINSQVNANLNMELQDGDLIKIYPVHDTMYKVVYLEGHVKYPQEYEYKEGMKIRDLIPSYDYLLADPYLTQAEVVRLMPPDLHSEIVQFNLGAMLSGDDSQNLSLQDQDRVIVYSKWDKQDRPKVTINGEVRNPGSYYLLNDMTLKDLIFGAGNLTDKAYLDSAELTRFAEDKNGIGSSTVKLSIKKALQGDKDNNLRLNANDVIQVREIPSYSQALERKIYLEGEFVFPGEYSFTEGERLSSVISRAGGITADAYPFGAIFQREAVKASLKTSYEEYEGQLEKDVSNLTAMVASSGLAKEDLATIQTTLTEKKALLDKLKSSEPTGRMLINLNTLLSAPSSDSDFKLRSGDRLIVSKKQDFVNITGEVYNSTAVLFEEGRSVDYYLSKVGGVTKSAAKNQIYVVKANGTVISKQQGGLFGLGLWDEGNSRWSFGGFGSIALDPGDTIIVPQKTASIDWLKGISNVTQILYQIAVAAQVVHAW